MPTKTSPKQDKLTLETPFGQCIVHDWRPSNDGILASVNFEELTVNNKGYKSVSFYLTKRPHAGPYLDCHYFNRPTDAAMRKLSEYFTPGDGVREELEVYTLPLNPADVRAYKKDRIKHDIVSELYKVTSSRHTEDQAEVMELMDEVLKDVIKARKAGKTFGNIYFDK